MVIRTFFDRNNTLLYNNNTNVGRNPITELYYGGNGTSNSYSRFIFQFDETKLKGLYEDSTFNDLSELKHTLRMTNTGAFDTELLGDSTYDGKQRSSSFDLIIFPITQEWDEGVGYDYSDYVTIGESIQHFGPSNWFESGTNTPWESNGVYSGSPTTIAIQHFEQGNENIEMDITDIVNGYLTGDTNNGLGLAYIRTLEETETTDKQYVGFFTRHTQTFYEPFIETVYGNHIKDDRNDFYLDKNNKLYLYVNLGGNPTNLDEIPSVNIFDTNDNLFRNIPNNEVTHVSKGVYSIDVNVPSANYTDCSQFTDTWGPININGITRPDAELDFVVKDGGGYFNIGDNSSTPKKVGLTVTGIRLDERVYRGDIRKVIVSTRIPYTINQKQSVDSLKYRLYVKEGRNEYTVIDFQDIEMSNNQNYFLLDTESLVPGTYYLDIQVESNYEVLTNKEILSFDIVSQSDLRDSN